MCVCVVGKMAKDIWMTIRKSIEVSFLPAFLVYIPSFICSFISKNIFLLLVFFGGGGGGGMDCCCCMHSCSLWLRR